MTGPRKKQFAGMKAIFVILFGQFFSILTSTMTNFAMTIWAYEKTGQATALALVSVAYMVPIVILGPFTGTIVDRVSRKLLMIISDLSAVMVTIGFLTLYSFDRLEMWHIYIGVAIISIFQTVQWPAFSSAMSLMIPKDQLTRANSLMGISGPGSQIISPIMAGALLPLIGFRGIMIIDIITATLAVGTLFFIFIPDPERIEKAGEAKPSFLQESLDGFRYLLKRPSLIWLQSMFMVGNFISALTIGTLFAPMILARTGNNELIFGTVQTIGAVGGLVGGLILGVWGGFKRQIKGVYLGWLMATIGSLIVGFGRGNPLWMAIPLWGVGNFINFGFATMINASNQTIWQSKVPPEMQGRVFTIRRMIAVLVDPLGALIAGPLADQVMEPAMREGGSLTQTFGWLVGVGPGAGMSLIMIFGGVVGILSIFIFMANPLIRNVEDILPDYIPESQADQQPAV